MLLIGFELEGRHSEDLWHHDVCALAYFLTVVLRGSIFDELQDSGGGVYISKYNTFYTVVNNLRQKLDYN